MMKKDSRIVMHGERVDAVVSRFIYGRVFMYGSLQFCGHVMEYFAEHAQDVMIFIVQPRLGPHTNLLRRYHAGRLVEERAVRSSQNLFLYFFLWFVNNVREVLRFCPKHQKTLVFGGHPVVFFGMTLLKMLRPLVYAYWIGDYFPSSHPVIRVYESVKKWYHDRVGYAFYLSDAINRVMNGSVVAAPRRRTVMWGVNPFPAMRKPSHDSFELLFVGLIRPGQGIEALLDFIAAHPAYKLNIIGVGQPAYVAELQQRINRQGVGRRVFYPDRFYSEAELLEIAHDCHAGIALYDTRADNFTHYADPGKVKAYAEMRLPVVMTRVSDIAPYVERFRSGEVLDRIDQIGEALERIRASYSAYQEGVGRFLEHFAYDRYYRDAFKAMEDLWK